MKAIILSRVSTVKQDLLQQTNELLKEVKLNGYSDSDIIIIENKESGISNDEEHLNGISQMKELILSDKSINAVYVYEVSRLSRRPAVLYSIRDFLLKNNIQLVILKPYLRLIDIDGRMSQSASIMFSLFSSISESEMMIKKERMMRGKRMKMAQGKYSGGNVCFGYTIDEKTKDIVIDAKRVQTVRKIYNMYTEEDHSVRSIAKELMETGSIPQTEFENAIAFIKLVLKSKQYIGGTSAKGLQYPQIITSTQYEKAREKSIAARKAPKSKTQYEPLAKKLLYYKDTGRLMTATKRNYSISSIKHQKFWSVSGEAIDKITWHYAKQYFKANNMGNSSVEIERLRNEVFTLINKHMQCFKNMSKLKAEHNRIEMRIIKGKMDEAKGDMLLDKIAKDVQHQKEQAEMFKYQIEVKKNQFKLAENNKTNIDGEMSTADKIHIIRRTISHMEIESTEGYGCSSLCITFIDNSTVNIEIQKKNRYLKVFENGLEVSLSCPKFQQHFVSTE